MTDITIEFQRRQSDIYSVVISESDNKQNEAIIDIFYENLDGLLDNLRKGLNARRVEDFYFNDFVVVKIDNNYAIVAYSDDTLLSLNAYKIELGELIDVLEEWKAFKSQQDCDVMKSVILNVEIFELEGKTD
ncbi:MAG: hypothetical protein AB8B97_21095 [Granulosicoccus sp.]